MYNYQELTPAGALERLNSLIAKAHGKSEQDRGTRVLVSKTFLIRLRELMTGEVTPVVVPEPLFDKLAVLKEGHRAFGLGLKLKDSPYAIDMTDGSEYRLWYRGWWLGAGHKPEPTEV